MPFTFQSQVRYSEIGEDGYLTLPGIVDYFQDVSTFQSESLGVGIAYLKERGLAWILASWQIEIAQFPKLCDPVTAATWPYDFKDFFGYRNFSLSDPDGRMYAWANSVWILYDMAHGRPARVGSDIMEKYENEPRLDMVYEDRKIRVRGEGAAEDGFVIGRQHLDTNHHVNNGQYISMAMEYLPRESRIRQMRAEYRSQAHLGDEVIPCIYREEPYTTVSLNNREGRPFAVVRFRTGE